MFRSSSIAYAIILLLVSKLFHLVLQISLPEAMTAGMAFTIVVYLFVSWPFLNYAFNRLCYSFDHQMARDDLLSRLSILILFMSWIPGLLVLTFQVTALIQDSLWLVSAYCTFLVLLANRKTLLYEEYLAVSALEQPSGLKPQ